MCVCDRRVMTVDPGRSPDARARDAARARLRRATRVSVGASLALGGVLATLAAGATHTKKAPYVQRVVRRTRVLTVAPAPPLVAVADQAAEPQTAAPVAPPTPSYAPPVVSSGGS